MRAFESGSSPLTRGKPASSWGWPRPPRLIPAHAGKTSRPPCPASSHSAHPRSRGENRARRDFLVARDGSSPLTRGKQTEGHTTVAVRGLIPAHAGKTARPRRHTSPRRAHPRSRRENEMSDQVRAVAAGSSPLTRGKLHVLSRFAEDERLIPAHAGKTHLKCNSSNHERAHPRSCGENHPAPRGPRTPVGSSPLMRGKRSARGCVAP